MIPQHGTTRIPRGEGDGFSPESPSPSSDKSSSLSSRNKTLDELNNIGENLGELHISQIERGRAAGSPGHVVKLTSEKRSPYLRFPIEQSPRHDTGRLPEDEERSQPNEPLATSLIYTEVAVAPQQTLVGASHHEASQVLIPTLVAGTGGDTERDIQLENLYGLAGWVTAPNGTDELRSERAATWNIAQATQAERKVEIKALTQFLEHWREAAGVAPTVPLRSHLGPFQAARVLEALTPLSADNAQSSINSATAFGFSHDEILSAWTKEGTPAGALNMARIFADRSNDPLDTPAGRLQTLLSVCEAFQCRDATMFQLPPDLLSNRIPKDDPTALNRRRDAFTAFFDVVTQLAPQLQEGKTALSKTIETLTHKRLFNQFKFPRFKQPGYKQLLKHDNQIAERRATALRRLKQPTESLRDT